MTENEAIEEFKYCIEPNQGFMECRYASRGANIIAISALEEIQQYRALGTVEELQKAKTQYENIASCAEKISMGGLCDYEEAQQNIVSSLKATSENTLEEYIKIGTPEELREAMEKQMAKKPYIEAEKATGLHENYDCYECPNCDSFLGCVSECKDEHYRYDYCPNCGQAIDWSEEK